MMSDDGVVSIINKCEDPVKLIINIEYLFSAALSAECMDSNPSVFVV